MNKNDVVVIKKNVNSFNVKKLNLEKTNFERKPSNAFGVVTIDCDELKRLLGKRISGRKILEIQIKEFGFPKYLYSFISKAHEITKATNPKRMGFLHVYFGQRKFRSVNEWKRFYNKKHPTAINEAIEIIYKAMETGMGKTRKDLKKYIKIFVEDFIYNRTFSGLKIQEAIFKKMSEIKNKNYKWATAKEDSSGIDGYIGEIPVSIKPSTSNEKKKAGTKRMKYTINKEKMTLSFTFSY